MSGLLSRIWRSLSIFQHPILWLLNSKYIIGVNLIIFDDSGKLWLQQHRFWPEQSWGLPGGHMKSNETPERAGQREMQEETGLTVGNLKLIYAETSWRRGLVLYYRAELAGGTLVLDNHELVAADFFAIDALPHPLLPSHHKIITLVNQ